MFTSCSIISPSFSQHFHIISFSIIPPFSHHFPSFFHHFHIVFPSFSHHFPIIFPSCSHHFPSFSHHFHIVFPSFSHHFPIIFPSCSHHFPSFFHHFHIVFPCILQFADTPQVVVPLAKPLHRVTRALCTATAMLSQNDVASEIDIWETSKSMMKSCNHMWSSQKFPAADDGIPPSC